jgi:hypothetical protein
MWEAVLIGWLGEHSASQRWGCTADCHPVRRTRLRCNGGRPRRAPASLRKSFHRFHRRGGKRRGDLWLDSGAFLPRARVRVPGGDCRAHRFELCAAARNRTPTRRSRRGMGAPNRCSSHRRPQQRRARRKPRVLSGAWIRGDKNATRLPEDTAVSHQSICYFTPTGSGAALLVAVAVIGNSDCPACCTCCGNGFTPSVPRSSSR